MIKISNKDARMLSLSKAGKKAPKFDRHATTTCFITLRKKISSLNS